VKQLTADNPPPRSAASGRRLPIGAEVVSEGVRFRVWTPVRDTVEVVFEAGTPPLRLDSEGNGYFSGLAEGLKAGALYRFRLDGGEKPFPDPASRFQPDGSHGPSQVVDPAAFRWTDQSWPGVKLRGQVIYEMHVGTFTREGTWRAAARELRELAAAGITIIEVLPVAEFPGRFGWGYDGVNLFAPTRLYGTPEDLRHFIDQAHSAGIGVILDVVYNHLGPDGNYLKELSPDYFTDRYENEWGEAINFDGNNAAAVREFFLANAAYWIEEFHFDGLRLDATQQIFDRSPRNIIAEISDSVRRAAGQRSTVLLAENEPQDTNLVRKYGVDGMWNDDFHHTAVVALTSRTEAYFTDYCGSPQEFVSAAKHGFLYQGQRYKWQKQRRGTPALDLNPAAFVNFLENHDQVANSARGRRLWQRTSPGRFRAMTALLLLMPATPMLFQGQEFSASAPFVYFADHQPELARLVERGRARFLAQFPSLKTPEARSRLHNPADPAWFERCKLDFSEREKHGESYALHRDLLHLRRHDPVLSRQEPRALDGAVISGKAFLLRFFGDNNDDRLLLVNLGSDLHFDPAPEPLIAPSAGARWRLLWSSEDPRYGGSGTPEPESEQEAWRIPGESALVMAPVKLRIGE
jgi:maltooligosyltrehalose trehalohydrolase